MCEPLALATVAGVVLEHYPDLLEVIGETSLPSARSFTLVRCRKTATVFALSSTSELRSLAYQLISLSPPHLV